MFYFQKIFYGVLFKESRPDISYWDTERSLEGKKREKTGAQKMRMIQKCTRSSKIHFLHRRYKTTRYVLINLY